jgi:hypothetical protein
VSTDKSRTPRIPRTKISVKVYDDKKECCEGTKEYKVCKNKVCLHVPAVKPLWGNQQLEYVYKVKGTTFETEYGHKSSRRRRLLSRAGVLNCRL